MRVIDSVIGNRTDAAFAEALHRLQHGENVDILTLDGVEISRRRFRATTARGKEIAIALPRDQRLHDGAVLILEADYALLVQVTTPRWLRCVPSDAAAALELGYHAGNLHWRVEFDGAALMVALEGPPVAYRARLRHMIDAGSIFVEGDDAKC